MTTSTTTTPTLLSPLLLLLLLTLTNPTTAQTTQPSLLPTTLPPCTAQCTPLLNAQTLCLPPSAPVTDEQTYKTCFCNSAYLTPLQTGITGLCDQVCTPESLNAIKGWFVGFCASGGEGATTATAGVAGSQATVVESVTSATSRDTSLPATATVGSSPTYYPAETNGPQRGWWSTHWNWVLFLILLFLLMILFSIGGVLLKRRYHRKRASKTSPQDPSYLPYTTNPTNPTTTNPNNAEAGLGGGGSGVGGLGGIRTSLRSGTGSIKTPQKRRSTTQEMLQSGEWGPLAAGHHTGYKEGYNHGGKGSSSVRFDEGSGSGEMEMEGGSGEGRGEVKRSESRGNKVNKVRKKRSLREKKVDEGIGEEN